MSFQLKFQEFLSLQKQHMTDSLDGHSSDDHMSEWPQQCHYERRCHRLVKRCEQIKLDNERLVSNIIKMKRLSHKYSKHKKLIIKRLIKHKDDYLNNNLPLFLEKEESSTQQLTTSDLKSKQLMVRSANSNQSSRAKKSRPNSARNEITSNGTVCVAPKKPINPYLLFCQENRSQLQEKYFMKYNTEMTHQELTKALAQQWHELSVNAKQIYYNLFNNDKIRYENEMKLFAANSSKESASESID